MVNFIADLKASNIAVNIIRLKDYSKQIELLLSQINIENNNIAQSNLKHCEEAVKTAQNTTSIELLNEYIKLGDIFKFLIPDIKDNTNNLKYGKQIAIHYLDIAKLTKDERIKNLAFAIADELSQ
jgi:CTP synthase (UTP-ammonia lyase)